MEENKSKGAFTAPPSVGNAQPAKSGGVVTAKAASKEAAKSVKSIKRDIKVVAIAKGWFDCKRISIGTKFNVSEDEFSDKWMQKL